MEGRVFTFRRRVRNMMEAADLWNGYDSFTAGHYRSRKGQEELEHGCAD
jgi:hypothetical protein